MSRALATNSSRWLMLALVWLGSACTQDANPFTSNAHDPNPAPKPEGPQVKIDMGGVWEVSIILPPAEDAEHPLLRMFQIGETMTLTKTHVVLRQMGEAAYPMSRRDVERLLERRLGFYKNEVQPGEVSFAFGWSDTGLPSPLPATFAFGLQVIATSTGTDTEPAAAKGFVAIVEAGKPERIVEIQLRRRTP